MTNLSKFIYWFMLVICICGITLGILIKNYNRAIDDFALLCWVGIAFMNEKRAIRAEKEINENNKYH